MYRLLYSARFQSYSALPLAYSVPAGWESVGEYPSHQMAMKPITEEAPAVFFFYEHAGYSWNAKTETEEEGRRRCAHALADAEAKSQGAGCRYNWSHDMDSDRSGIEHDAPLWICDMFDSEGEPLGCLGGIDLGENPFGPGKDAYARVVEAELALDNLS